MRIHMDLSQKNSQCADAREHAEVKPYQKPVLFSFLLKSTKIESGPDNILESQGSGFLDS